MIKFFIMTLNFSVFSSLTWAGQLSDYQCPFASSETSKNFSTEAVSTPSQVAPKSDQVGSEVIPHSTNK